MKKVRLLIAMMLVVAALTVGVMAAETDYVGFELEQIETGDAITVKVVSKEGFDAAFCTFGVGYASDKWTISNISNTTDAADTGSEVGYVKDGALSISKDGTILSFTATPVGDAASVVGETFTLNYCTCVSSTEEILVAQDGVYDTLTVKAAGPVAVAGTKKFDATFDASDIEIDGVTYQNVAVINGSATAPVLAAGESITKVGIEYDGDEVKDLTEISGGGNVTYKVLFYGITDAEAEALAAKVKTFYTGMFFPAN